MLSHILFEAALEKRDLVPGQKEQVAHYMSRESKKLQQASLFLQLSEPAGNFLVGSCPESFTALFPDLLFGFHMTLHESLTCLGPQVALL